MPLLARGCPVRVDGAQCHSLSKDDIMYIGIATGLCVLVLAGLATWVLVYRCRQRRKRRAEATPQMGEYASHGRAPLLSTMYQQPEPSPPLSPMSPYADSYASPSSGENFHFPLLSADGHLLPAAPASARYSVKDDRPLPAPPSPVVGLWPEHLSVGPDRPASPRSAGSTPRLSPGLGYLQPQAAVYHRSFSSEGQYYQEIDIGVRR